jgi:competence protein ComFC
VNPFFAQIRQYTDDALSFIAGETCFACKSRHGFLCDDCKDKLPYIEGPVCRRCAIPLEAASDDSVCGACLANPPVFQKTFAPFLYSGFIKDLILESKFNKKYYYINRLMAIVKNDIELKLGILKGAQAIIPVPLSRKRLIERGYNQALIIANELSRFLNIPVKKDLILKSKDVPPQANLSRGERFKNIKNAFSLRNRVNFAKVIIVDDIITTTATVNEAAKIVKKGGADEIYVFALCRTKD